MLLPPKAAPSEFSKSYVLSIIQHVVFQRLSYAVCIPTRFIKPTKRPEKVNVVLFRNGWCPVQSIACERALRASTEFPGKVDIREYDAKNRKIVNEWGIHEGLYIDGKEVRTGPPPSYVKIRNKIAQRVKKIHR